MLEAPSELLRALPGATPPTSSPPRHVDPCPFAVTAASKDLIRCCPAVDVEKWGTESFAPAAAAPRATGAGDGAGRPRWPFWAAGVLNELREWFGSPDCSWLFSEDGGWLFFFFFEKEKKKKKKNSIFGF